MSLHRLMPSTLDRETIPPPAVRHACTHLLSVVDRDEPARFVTDTAAWLLIVMIGDAAWCAPALREQLVGWSDAMVAGLVGDQIGPAAEQGAAAYRGLYDHIDGALERRRHDATGLPLDAPGCTDLDPCDLVGHSPIDIDDLLPMLLAGADPVARV